MRACWAATLLVLVQPSPAFCATCKGTSVVPRVLAPAHRHLRKSPSVRQPFAEISGSISFSPLVFLSRKLCPILCATSRVHSIAAEGYRLPRTQRAAREFPPPAPVADEGSRAYPQSGMVFGRCLDQSVREPL